MSAFSYHNIVASAWQVKAYDWALSFIENYKNCLDDTKRLVNLNPFDKQSMDRFKEEVQREKVLAEKQWLLNQLNEH